MHAKWSRGSFWKWCKQVCPAADEQGWAQPENRTIKKRAKHRAHSPRNRSCTAPPTRIRKMRPALHQYSHRLLTSRVKDSGESCIFCYFYNRTLAADGRKTPIPHNYASQTSIIDLDTAHGARALAGSRLWQQSSKTRPQRDCGGFFESPAVWRLREGQDLLL